MSSITFYRQARFDGGVRTGVEVDDDTVLARFDAGKSEDDPILLWFVDVRCTGRNLPKNAAGACAWLIDNASVIRNGLKELAVAVAIGADSNTWPILHVVPHSPAGSKVVIAFSAANRLAVRDLPKILRDIAKRWSDLIMGTRPRKDG